MTLLRDFSARQRLVAAFGLGILGGLATVPFAPWQLAVLIGWDVTAVVFVLWVWLAVHALDPKETSEHATREDNSPTGAHLLLLVASLVSLVGVGFDLVKANESSGSEHVVMTIAGVLTVALSWAAVHTLYALRYAHEYYIAPVGGIDFKTREEPDYQDFAYVAFTVGMTFQVSDTDVKRRLVRRTVLRHALLSYLFGAVIVAVMVNVIGNLLG
jgi:uncharacterized membrane protein